MQKAKILFPLSQIGPISYSQRTDLIKQSRLYGKYDTPVDRESAYEILVREKEEALQAIEENAEIAEKKEVGEKKGKARQGVFSKVAKAVITAVTATIASAVGTAVSDKVTGKKTKSTKSTKEKIVKNTTSAATRTITREITRDILGNLTK